MRSLGTSCGDRRFVRQQRLTDLGDHLIEVRQPLDCIAQRILVRLGEVRADVRFGENEAMRWLEVAPPGSNARLYLVKEDDTMQSAGGIYSTASDMARWLTANLAAAHGVPTPIPADVIAATHRPVAAMEERFEMFRRTGYGLGWYSGEFGGETLYHSFGGFAGARAHVSFMPARDVGVAVLVYLVLGVIWLLPLRRFLIWMETGRWG